MHAIDSQNVVDRATQRLIENDIEQISTKLSQ
jgi:hypothetical protein